MFRTNRLPSTVNSLTLGSVGFERRRLLRSFAVPWSAGKVWYYVGIDQQVYSKRQQLLMMSLKILSATKKSLVLGNIEVKVVKIPNNLLSAQILCIHYTAMRQVGGGWFFDKPKQ